MHTEKLGFIGLGRMGHPMAKNLEKAGFSLNVYNRTSHRTDAFKDHSTPSDSIHHLITNSEVIFTMLTNDAAVNAVYQDIVKEPIEGKLFVDMSTISQQASLQIHQQIRAKGGFFIDAPVAGSTKPAAEGTLIIMVGGEPDEVQRAWPYLEKMGKLVKHLGGSGSGLAAKISINYYLAMVFEGLAETILLSDKLGVVRKDMLEIINESASGSGATKLKTPLLLESNYKPAFSLDLMLKDIQLAQDAGANFPVGKITLETYKKAKDAGHGANDVMGIIDFLSDL